jgi:hypothetical protein
MQFRGAAEASVIRNHPPLIISVLGRQCKCRPNNNSPPKGRGEFLPVRTRSVRTTSYFRFRQA